MEGSFREKKRGGKGEGSRNDKDFFLLLKRERKLGIFLFFFFFQAFLSRLSFANSTVSHRPRVKQKTGKEIIAPFPGKIYFRESASDKVLDKVLPWVENKNPRASRDELKGDKLPV